MAVVASTKYLQLKDHWNDGPELTFLNTPSQQADFEKCSSKIP